MADRTLSLACADPALARFIDAHQGPNGTQAAGTLVDHRLTLDGTATGWRLGLDDATLAEGQTPAAGRVVIPRRLILSRYAPDAPPCCRPATPEEALSGIIAAESVVRALDQAKLDALARWVSRLPADHLTYPDLDSGLALVRACLDEPDQARVAGS